MTRTCIALFALSGLALCFTGCEPRSKALPEPVSPSTTAPSSAAAARASAPSGEGKFTLEQLEHAVPAGQPARITFGVKPGSGLKINPEYPWKLELDAQASSAEVEVAGAPVLRDAMSFEDALASIPLSVTAKKPGTHEVAANISLSVCEKGDASRCLLFRDVPVDLVLTAK